MDTPCENRVLQRRNISARYQLFDTDRHRTLRAPSSNSSAVRDLQSISDPLSFRESSLTVPSACNAPSRRRIVRAYKKYKSEILLVANCCVIILIRRRDDSPPVQKKSQSNLCALKELRLQRTRSKSQILLVRRLRRIRGQLGPPDSLAINRCVARQQNRRFALHRLTTSQSSSSSSV